MKIGILGYTNSGKTTIYNALTGSNAEVNPYPSIKSEPNISVVEVFDQRISDLSELYQPKKTVYAKIEYIDFPGLGEDAAKSGAFSASAMSEIKNTDAIAVVVRNFNDEIINESYGKPDPVSKIEEMNSELIITDLIVAENRLEKILLGYKRGIKTPEIQIEEKTLRKITESLSSDIPIRKINLEPEEEKAIRGFRFMSQKSLLVILNSDEESFGNSDEIIDRISENFDVIEFAGKFEMELTGLEEEEKEMFMEDMGIKDSAKNRLTSFSYQMLNLISFFTVGKDEVRAWTINKDENVVNAAGTIHSDLARGFIRAECYSYEDIMKYGSEKELRDRGIFRLEGKDYVVKDGDILNIRFNV